MNLVYRVSVRVRLRVRVRIRANVKSANLAIAASRREL